MKQTAPLAVLALLGVLLVAPAALPDSSGPGGRFNQRLRLLEERMQSPNKPASKPRVRATPARAQKVAHPEPARVIVSKRLEHTHAIARKRIVNKRVERSQTIVSRRVEPARPSVSRQTKLPRVSVSRRPERQTRPRTVAAGRQVPGPAPIREVKGFLSARVSYSVASRSARATGPKETGDLILLAEPRKARVFFYVRGGSQLPGITTASMKGCKPQKMHVVVYAPELRGRSQAFVPVQPNRVTTVRFVFPDPQRKFAGKSESKTRRQEAAGRAAGPPAITPDPTGGTTSAAFAPAHARASSVSTAP